MRAISAVLFTIFAAAACPATPPDGIPRSLADGRARLLSDVRYHLEFTVTPHADRVSGHEDLEFRAKEAAATLLDFREGTISKMVVNGAELSAQISGGHIELPLSAIRAGENSVSIDFVAAVAPAGKAITRFDDKDDNAEYLYTLFVPMDAEMAFPCFDQPDLKGRFRLELIAPGDWSAISNTAPQSESPAGRGQKRTAFAETRPISTYLFAFAAGPFRRVQGAPGWPALYVRQSKLQKAEAEAPELQKMAADGIRYLSDYFAQPFPFPKYDQVLIPGFAYGGMEHAGATFLREESVLFRTAPTHSDYLNRDILVLHELTHQWFGDFTTMRWFDDLWLKEGFAQFMAYQVLADLLPEEEQQIWERFYLAINSSAYAIDSTKGTTAIHQDIGNLKDAKSAYGAIVYSKAPAVIRQLAFVLGDQFRAGLRLYLDEHAYGNAEWGDLVHSFERASGRSLENWAAVWIGRRGMPQVDVKWGCDAQRRIDRFQLSQRDVLGENGIWPMAIEVRLAYAARETLLHLEWNAAAAEVPEAVGRPCPDYVFLNDGDHAYGRFLLDARSQAVVMEQLGAVRDVLHRAMLWGSLWDSVREVQLAPREYLDLALKLVPAETEESLAQNLTARITTSLHRYVNPQVRAGLLPTVERLASDRMRQSQSRDLRILWFRALRAVAESEAGRAELKDLLAGRVAVPGVELRPLDRWTMVTALISDSDAEADAYFAAEQKRDQTGDGQKFAYVAQAARPDAATKQRYFQDYLSDRSRPEDWIEQSLDPFNAWNQSSLTLPFLRRALDALPQIKRERKIFFVLGWLNAFIGGQQSAAAQSEVSGFLANQPALDRDLRLKILEVSDELDRTVRIRQRFP